MVGEPLLKWEKMEKTFKGFKLAIEPGEIRTGEIVGILDLTVLEKTTFVRFSRRRRDR